MDKFSNKEAGQKRSLLEQLQSDLLNFEQQYQLSSVEFYRKYQAGEKDDRLDFVEWASLKQMLDNAQKKLALLTENTA